MRIRAGAAVRQTEIVYRWAQFVPGPVKGQPADGAGIAEGPADRMREVVRIGRGRRRLEFQLRRARSGMRERKEVEGPNTRFSGLEGEPAAGNWAMLDWEGRREGEKQRGVGGDAVLILRQSGGGPVHAPCPMRGSRFPEAHLPPAFLPGKYNVRFCNSV